MSYRSDDARATRRGLPHHWRVFTVVTATAAMASLDGGMVPIIFADIERTFSDSAATTLSWVFTAYTIGLASFVVASGRLSDRTGRRRVFLSGVSMFVLASAVCAIAPTPAVLVLARFIQGTGHALCTPSSLGILLEAWPTERRTQAIGAWIGVGGIASGVGPTVGALIVEAGDWRMAFLLNVAIGVPTMWRAKRLLDRTVVRSDAPMPDPIGIGVLSVALGLLSLVIVQGRTWGWGDSKIVVSAAMCAALAVVFVHRSRHHPAPVLDVDLLRSRTYRVSLAVSALVSMSMLANLVMQPQFLEEAWGYSTLKAGLAVTPLPVLAGITAPFAGRLAARYGHRTVILLGVALTTVGLFAYALLPDESPDYFTEFLPGVALAGVGTWGLAISMINAAAVSDMSTANFGVGTAVLQTVRQVGGMLGVAIFFGFIGDPAPDEIVDAYTRMWLVFALPPTLALLLALRLPASTGKTVPAATTTHVRD